jgi:3-phosphoshikimate 1-carboxyvinyltransferase
MIRNGKLRGVVSAYPSKSYAQRALMLGLLDTNGLTIDNFCDCSDTLAALDSVIRLGANVVRKGKELKITGPKDLVQAGISCNESGLCLRMFAPVLALSGKEFKISCSPSLLRRGNDYISQVLSLIGAETTLDDSGLTVKGPIRSGNVHLKNPPGSQLVSGLLFALSKTEGDSRIFINDPVSSPYVKMTAGMLNEFGADIRISNDSEIFIAGDREFKNGSISIEGDWSSAAFFLVAGAFAGEVFVTDLDPNSIQPDRCIIEYLRKAGAHVEQDKFRIKTSISELKGFEADIKDHPDLFIPLVILALNCEGESRIYNYERLKYKESDRPSAVVKELRKAGAEISVAGDCISISKSRLSYAEMETYGDHRLAMGFAVAALNSDGGLKIKDPACVNKSFPLFFESLESLVNGAHDE